MTSQFPALSKWFIEVYSVRFPPKQALSRCVTDLLVMISSVLLAAGHLEYRGRKRYEQFVTIADTLNHVASVVFAGTC